MKMSVEYCFHPVGQGLFSAGRLTHSLPFNNYSRRDFQWVYDCGTSSSPRLVRNALGKFQSRVNGRRLDLVVISHFDADHISGMVQLLNDVGTRTLMLPWAPLWHRLVIGYAQGLNSDDPEFAFYTDPAQYLVDQAGEGFDQLVFVPFSDRDGPADPDEDGEPDFDPDGYVPLKIEAEAEIRLEKDDQDGMAEWMSYLSDARHRRKMMMMYPRGTAFIPRLWEFVPYNDPATKPKNEARFVERVNDLRDNLLSSSDNDRKKALRDLKDHYLRTFPKSQLNDLSLFLYGGPIGHWWSSDFWFTDLLSSLKLSDGSVIYTYHGNLSTDHQLNGSVIYTGDGNLSTDHQWQSLAGYLGHKRSFQPSVFQVPHHGSKSNWFTGLASMIEPRLSVFSSDPGHRSFGHPHADVLRDLWPFQPIQVDKARGFQAKFLLSRN